jgi:hypothetical protein
MKVGAPIYEAHPYTANHFAGSIEINEGMSKAFQTGFLALVICGLLAGSLYILSVASLLGDRAGKINSAPKDSINLRSFGARGDGVADDTDAIRRAVNVAASMRRALFAPAGIYRIDARADAGRSVILPDGTRIVGAGVGQTVFKAFPERVDQYQAMFIAEADSIVSIEDLTMKGPDDPNGGTWANGGDGSRTTIGVLHRGLTGSLRLNRISTSSFTHAFKADPGTVLVELRDSDVSALSQGVLCVGAGKLHAFSTRFHDTGAQANDPNAPRDHHLYLSYATAVEIDHCSFEGSFGVALHIFGGRDNQAVPAYVKISNSRFLRSQAKGILSHKNRRTVVTNCVFESENAVLIRNDIDLIGCTFNGAGTQVQDYFGGHGKLRVEDCSFGGGAGGIVSTSAGNDWSVSNTKFLNRGEAIYATNGPYTFRLSENTFRQRGYAVEANGQGKVYASRGTFGEGKLLLGGSVEWVEWSGTAKSQSPIEDSFQMAGTFSGSMISIN